MKPRVVLVIGQLHQGGAEGQLVHLARGLDGAGFQPSVACLSEVAEPHAASLRSAGVAVTVFPRRRGRDLSRVTALASLLRETRADLVHSFLVGANAYAYAACRLALIRRIVVSSRTTMSMRSRAARWLHSWVFRHASIVIANAESVRDFTISYYGAPAGRLRVVRNGVDLRPYRDADGARVAARRELGIVEGAVVGGTLGRLSREKNLELFADMAAGLGREFPGLKFVLIGDGPHRRAIEAALDRNGARGNVILAGARADVARILQALDFFVLTSDTEGLPNAVMEAMAAGLPVVATRVGGVGEVVVEGETGTLVPAGELIPLLAAVRSLVCDAALRRRLGDAGRARIASQFGVQRMVAGTAAVYEEILSSGGRS